MKRLLYISAHRFIRNECGEVFTTGQMGPAYFERFREISEKVTVIGLCEPLSLHNKAKIVEQVNLHQEYVRYLLIPSKTSIIGVLSSYRKLKKVIISQMQSHDFFVTKAPSIIASYVVNRSNKLHHPCLVELVACPWDSYWNHSFIGKLVAPFITLSTQHLVKKASHVTYVTNNFLQSRYPTKGKQIAVSDVALTSFDEAVLEKRLQRINQYTGTIVLGTTAVVNVHYKGQQYIIQALGRLKQQGITNYEYQLVGGGDQSYLKGIAHKYGVEDQIKFLGPLPHDRVFEWLDTIDIYIQPSRTEGLPRSLIEAMSRALPAFAAKTGGIPELLDTPFLFSNNHNNITEICNILHTFTKEKMCETATQNFRQAKTYATHIINEKRSSFFEEFIKEE